MTDLVGQTIGNYRIESVLGKGGMGEVYRGVHALLDRPAAIKVMHPSMAADPSFQARFLLEAKAAASLNHSNIVEIYDFGEQNSICYLVMELITGGSVRGLLQARAGQTLALTLSLDLVRQAAEGLGFAHAKGMVHRDIKPDNLLLRVSGPNRYVAKISDFGLARMAESSIYTMTGMALGTPAYMSPEQCQGLDLDARSDLYSLGVVLYELATGFLPFNARSLSAAVYAHVHTPPPSPRTQKADLPPAVEAIILRCLAKKPEDRYGSAAEMITALSSVLGDAGLATVAPTFIPGRPQPAPPQPATSQAPMLTAGATMLKPVDTGNMPPNAPPGGMSQLTNVNTSRVPRLRVLDKDGRAVKVIELTGDGITVGRTNDNTIMLADDGVSRHHLRVDWDGNRVTVTDLGSSNGSLLEGVRLLPQVAQGWDGRQPLQIAGFWLRLDMPANTQTQLQPMSRPDPTPTNRIGVVADNNKLSVLPGQTALCRLTLRNQGSLVDHFKVLVDGVSEAWVQGAGREVQLNPGMTETVVLTFSPPRQTSSRAGEYPVTIRVRSRENPNESSTTEVRWTVLPFSATQLRISPVKASGRTGADYGLTLINEGNAVVRYQLGAADDEKVLRYHFSGPANLAVKTAPMVAVDPGAEQQMTVKVSAASRFIGVSKSRPFRISAIPQNGEAGQTSNAEFIHRAALPPWLPPVVLAAVVALAVLLYSMISRAPVIESYTLEPPNPIAGQPVTVRWKARNADTVEMQPLGEIVAAEQGQFTFEEGLPPNVTNLTLVAHNRFDKASQPIAFNPLTLTATPTPLPTPTTEIGAPVIEFSANGSSDLQTIINQGESVALSWRVQNADSTELQIGSATSSVDATGQQALTPLQDTTYTLSANNRSGKRTVRSIQVAVRMPPTVPPTNPASAGGTGNATSTPTPTATPTLEPTNTPTTTPTPIPPPPAIVPPDLAGDWYYDTGDMVITQSGNLFDATLTEWSDRSVTHITGGLLRQAGSDYIYYGRYLDGGPRGDVEITFKGDGQMFYGLQYWNDIKLPFCGARVGNNLPEGCDFQGHWTTRVMEETACALDLNQGIYGSVTGTSCNGGIVQGEVKVTDIGHVLVGYWGGDPNKGFMFHLDPIGGVFRGSHENGTQEWCGWRDGYLPPDPCLGP